MHTSLSVPKQECRTQRQHALRRGAVLPFIAIMLPVMIMICGFAINLAYMQLTRTELKIATDAGARAGGRAWSEKQSVTEAKLYARRGTSRNLVAGKALKLRNADSKNEIEFGMSVRNGSGRFVFTKADTSDVEDGLADANSIRITGKRNTGSIGGPINLLIGGVGATTQFKPIMTSTCIQLDRDVALVLDRSGSMAYGADDVLIFQMLDDLYDASKITADELKNCLAGVEDTAIQQEFSGIAADGFNIYDRNFSANVLNLLETDAQLQADYTTEEIANVKGYGAGINDYNENDGPAPPFSRWDILGQAVDSFFSVFAGSPQEEMASLGTFNYEGTLDQGLVDDSQGYTQIKNLIHGYDEVDPVTGDVTSIPGIRPWHGTHIGEGLINTLPSLMGDGTNPAPGARPFAAKTIVVMTDGRHNDGRTPTPTDAATTIMASNNVRIHTVTFTPQADKSTMQQVAAIGRGKHYHADNATELIAIFMEIANNLPTTMSQ